MEIYCFTSHRSFVRPICVCAFSIVSVRSLRLTCKSSNKRQFCVCAFSPSILRRLLLAHRLRRSANISPLLSYCVVFEATLNVGQRHRRRANINPALVQSIMKSIMTIPMLVQCWPTVCGAGSALYRRWVDVYLVLL